MHSFKIWKYDAKYKINLFTNDTSKFASIDESIYKISNTISIYSTEEPFINIFCNSILQQSAFVSSINNHSF